MFKRKFKKIARDLFNKNQTYYSETPYRAGCSWSKRFFQNELAQFIIYAELYSDSVEYKNRLIISICYKLDEDCMRTNCCWFKKYKPNETAQSSIVYFYKYTFKYMLVTLIYRISGNSNHTTTQREKKYIRKWTEFVHL